MVELLVRDEFLATITKEVDEGEVSYNLTMAILDIDIKGE